MPKTAGFIIPFTITLFTATNVTNELLKAVGRVFDELWDGITPIRQLGVHTSRVIESNGARQLNLFDMDRYEKFEKLDSAVDKIRSVTEKNL